MKNKTNINQQNTVVGPDAQIEEIHEKKIKKYIKPFIIGLIIFILTFLIKNPFLATNAKDVFRYLCDDATIPAICLFALWGLSFSSNKGGFDGLAFSFKKVIGNFIPAASLRNTSNYGDYKAIKDANRKPVMNEYLVSSMVFFILMIAFLIIYSLL